MNDNLITEIIDLNKVKANLLELQKMWEQLIVSMAAKSGKDLKFDVLAQNLKTVTTAENELTNVKKAGLEVDGKKVKITAEIIANYDKYSKEEKQIIENEIKRKHEISETNKLLKDKFTNEQNLTKVLQRETKSISDLDKQNKDLQRIQQKLNLTTKEGTDANAKINAQIEKNKTTTKEYTNVLDEQKRNIGNYPQTMGAAGTSVSKFSAGMVAAYAAIAMAASKVTAAVKGVIVEFLKVDKVNESVRQAFGSFALEIDANADIFEKATGIEAEAYQRLAVSAKAYGSANKDVNSAVMTAIGLSKEFELQGISQEVAMIAVVKAQNGQFTALNRIYPALKNVTDESEKMRIVNELAASGLKKATDYTDTYNGKIDLLMHSVGTLRETFGEGILDGILGEPEQIQEFTDGIEQVNTAFQETQIISRYLGMMREQAMMMLKPFLNLFKIFGDGGSAIDGLSVAVKAWMFVMQAVSTPVRLLWSYLAALTGVVLDVVDAFRNIKDLKFQDVLNIINKAFVTLLSTMSDLVGMSDEVSKFFGVQRDEISLTAEEQKKLNALLFDYKSIIKDVKKTIATNAEMKQLTEDLEEQDKVVDEVNKRYADYITNIKKINEDARLSIELGERRIEVRKKEIEAIYSATKA